MSGPGPHRLYVDEISFSCARCGGGPVRMPGVTGAWYDTHPEPIEVACGSRGRLYSLRAAYGARRR